MAIRVNGGIPIRPISFNDEEKIKAMRFATQRAAEDPNSPIPLDSVEQSWYVSSSEKEETS